MRTPITSLLDISLYAYGDMVLYLDTPPFLICWPWPASSRCKALVVIGLGEKKSKPALMYSDGLLVAQKQSELGRLACRAVRVACTSRLDGLL